MNESNLFRANARRRALFVSLSIGVIGLSLISPARAALITFTDTFDRPDGVVGNGWETGVGASGSPSSSLVIAEGKAQTVGKNGDYVYMSRDIDYSAPVSISAYVTGNGSTLAPFQTAFFFGGNGSVDNASVYLTVESRGQFFNYGTYTSITAPTTSGMGTTVINNSSNITYSATLSATIDPLLGLITGTLTPTQGGGIYQRTFSGSYDTRLVSLTNKIGIAVQNEFSTGPGNPATIDNVSITYTESGSTPDLDLAKQEFWNAFDYAHTTVKTINLGDTLTRDEVIASRTPIVDAIARREALELNYNETVRLIYADALLDIADASVTALAALGCVSTGGIPCYAVAALKYVAGLADQELAEDLLCKRDFECSVRYKFATFVVNPTFESFGFDLSFLIDPENSNILDFLNVGDSIGLNAPLFGDGNALTLVTLAGIEGSWVHLRFDGIRQLATAVPEPGTLALLNLAVVALAFSNRRKKDFLA